MVSRIRTKCNNGSCDHSHLKLGEESLSLRRRRGGGPLGVVLYIRNRDRRGGGRGGGRPLPLVLVSLRICRYLLCLCVRLRSGGELGVRELHLVKLRALFLRVRDDLRSDTLRLGARRVRGVHALLKRGDCFVRHSSGACGGAVGGARAWERGREVLNRPTCESFQIIMGGRVKLSAGFAQNVTVNQINSTARGESLHPQQGASFRGATDWKCGAV